MTKRIWCALAFFLLAAMGIFATPPDAAASDVTCSGLVGGQSTLTIVDGNVVVPNGKYCTLSFVNVTQVFYSSRGSTWCKSLILLDAGWRPRENVVPRFWSI